MKVKRYDLEIMSSGELQSGTNIEGRLKESIVVFEVVVEAKVLGYEAELRFGDVTFTVIVK